MKEFPLVYTNVWDGTIAVPLVLILVQVLKILFSIKGPYISTLSTVIGLIISIFFSHPHSLSAGIFMGFFYGNGAVGVYASLKTSLQAFQRKQ
ncbi:hypothetical protein [Priestia endophytica]|uniref:hypothetical protein n=1 Tax=Priestia endophytica TaxID=135735 RepID=UPI000DCA9253|nr:hypothetical protein [Priestia endophytica]RAS80188.1 hypothetical protein A4U60_16080 [Priestia endophytica]